jgi:Gpi18-like mannosyltransferase
METGKYWHHTKYQISLLTNVGFSMPMKKRFNVMTALINHIVSSLVIATIVNKKYSVANIGSIGGVCEAQT